MRDSKFTQPSVMKSQHNFSQVPRADIPRSKFDRSHAYKTTFDAGYLVPIYVDEVLPGDTFSMTATAFARLATPLKPVMDNMYCDVHFFFVPYRLVWENWQKFMGERVNPDDDPSTYTIPQRTLNSAVTSSSLANYFGIPVRDYTANPVTVSELPFRAYYLIWNEWYRDQNLQDSLPFSLGDTGSTGYGSLQRRGKRKDYFTSALPWPQKGDPVFIPLGVEAPVIVDPSGNPFPTFQAAGAGTIGALSAVAGNTQVNYGVPGDVGALYWSDPNLIADLTSATAVSINDLRTAFQVQRLLERDARGGTRYIEIILSHFGVQSDDARLQRPEYLGGGTSMVNINPVASTVVTEDAPQAELAGVGTTVGKAGFKKSFTEHGVIIGLISARADLTYQEGIERFWSRQTRYDFYWPALSHLGEQAILNKEIYVQGTSADDEPFGYQERYAEYRYKPSRVTGLFSSGDPASLDVWHLSQDFTALPVLNASFIVDNPPIDRIIAVPSEPHFLLDCWFQLYCDRPMPVYSVPGLVDHF